jgi:peroxiredoxin
MKEVISMGKVIDLGFEAPDFILKDQNNEEMRLSDFRGKNILLSFHPLAWTKVCTEQMNRLDVRVDLFEKLNTVAFGVSIDTVPCKKAWAKDIGIEKLRLLSDFWPHGDLASRLGIFREADGFSERANIVLNEKHEVIFTKIYTLSEQPDLREIEEFLIDYGNTSIDLDVEIKKCLIDNKGKLLCMQDLEAVGIHTTPKVDL